MEKNKKPLWELLALVISRVMTFGSWLIGCFIPTAPVWRFLAVGSIIILLAAWIISNIENRIFVRKTVMSEKLPNTRPTDDFDELKNNFLNAQKTLDKRIGFSTAYAVVLSVFILLACFFLGAAELDFSDDDGGLTILLITLLMFLYQGVVGFLLKKSKNDDICPDYELSETEFPLLTSMVKECADTANVKKKIRVFFIMGSSGFKQTNKAIYVGLDPLDVAYMTKDELWSVLYHEFVYCTTQNEKKVKKYDDYSEKIKGGLSMFGTKAFLKFEISKTLFSLVAYNTIAVKAEDIFADRAVIDRGLSQTYINAMAKANLRKLYSSYEWKETSFDTYADEKPVNNFVHLEFENLKKKLEIYRDRWFYTLDNEILRAPDFPATFSMQKKTFNVDSFDVNQTEQNNDYIAEQEKYLAFSDKIVYDSFTEESYSKAREQAYFARKKLFSKVEDEGDSFTFATENEKIECAQAYIGYDNAKALNLLDQVLSSSSNSLAYFLKGLILSDEYDDECIQMFKNAAQNTTFFDEAYKFLINYALKTGKQEVVDEFRKTIEDKKMTADEVDEANDIKNVKLSPPDKSDPANHEAVEAIKEYWGDALIAIYMAEHVHENGLKAKYIALDINMNNELTVLTKAAENTQELLFRLNDNDTAFYLFYNGAPFNKIRKTPDSLMFLGEKHKKSTKKD